MRAGAIARLCGRASAGLILFVVSWPAAAQSIEDLRQLSLDQLANIKITSVSKAPESLSEAAASIYVITAEDIRRSGATSLPEVLRLAPNLEVARLNAFTYSITARGFNSPESANKLLVLVDGRSVYSPLGSTVFWESVNVDLDDVERIEVISGPGGTLYGANAVNGVINVITRSAKDTQGNLADIGVGTEDRFGTVRSGVKLGDNAALRIYGTGFDRSALPTAVAGDRSNDGFSGAQAGFRSDGTWGAEALTLQGDIFRNTAGLGPGGPQAPDYKLSGGNLLGRWTHTLDNGSSFQLQAYFDQSNRVEPGLKDLLNTYDIQAQQNLSLGAHRFVWGAEFRAWDEGLFSQGPFFVQQPSQTLYVGNLFAQDEIALTSELKLTIGLKGEYDTFAGINLMPNLRLGWQVRPDTLLWAAVSRAVRTPSLIDRDLQATGILVPSPNFATEKLTAYELGYRAQPLATVTLSVSLFYNVYDDLRTDALTAGGLPIVLANGLGGDTYGVEAWATWKVLDWWRLRPGFNFLHKNLNLQPGATDISSLQSAGQDPAYQMQLRSEMNLWSQWEFDVTLRRVGTVTRPPITSDLVPAYFEADARLGWHVTPQLELSIDGYNLIHPQHIEAFDPSTVLPRYIPRSVLLQMRAAF